MGVVGSALCCACTGISWACSCFSCCFTAAVVGSGGISIQTAKVFYLLFIAIATIFALSFRYTADDWGWDDFDQWTVACDNDNPYCQGDASAYRISFVLSLFFLVHIPFACCGTKLHRGFWFFKILLFIAGIVGAVFIPNTVFNDTGYAWVARVVSSIFLLFQVLLLIGFGYDWNDRWLANADQAAANGQKRETGWLIAIIVSALILYALAFTGIVFLFKDYTSCSLGKGISSWTFICVIGMTVLSLFRKQVVGQEGAILPAAVVSCYTVYLGWDALQSDTSGECNFGKDVTDNEVANLVVSMVITSIGLMWAADRTSRSFSGVLMGDRAIEEDPNDERAQMAKEKERTEREEKYLWAFHFMMIVVSMYMSMVVTNWGTLQSISNDTDATARGSLWIKFISQMLTVFLYVWTLLAPKIFPDRDFSAAPRYTEPSGTKNNEKQVIASSQSTLNYA